MPDTEKINNPVIIEGVALLFSWIFGLILDDTIQKQIIQYPDSYNFYQLMQNILGIDKVITPILVFLWVVGTLIYIFKKFSK